MLRVKLRRVAMWIVIAISVGAAALFFGIREIAKSGNHLGLTYSAYHEGWLGPVVFGGCNLHVSEPWFPRLESYRSLEVSDQEVVFVDTEAPLGADGKAVAVNFIREVKQTRNDALGAVEVVGSIKFQRFPEEISSGSGLFAVWLPEASWYAVSKSREALQRALLSTKISCNSTTGT